MTSANAPKAGWRNVGRRFQGHDVALANLIQARAVHADPDGGIFILEQRSSLEFGERAKITKELPAIVIANENACSTGSAPDPALAILHKQARERSERALIAWQDSPGRSLARQPRPRWTSSR